MGKANLGALLGNLPSTAPTDPLAERHAVPQRRNSEPTKAPTESDANGPRYLSFVRKDTRIRSDQLEQLTLHARRLNRASSGPVRVTENTLIRVAIDLLLACIDDASGADENEIRESLR